MPKVPNDPWIGMRAHSASAPAVRLAGPRTRCAGLALLLVAWGAGGCGDAADQQPEDAPVASDGPAGNGRARTQPALTRAEADRLTRAIEALDRRVAALEQARQAPSPDTDPSAAAAAADLRSDPAADAREQKELRDRLLAGVASPADARRYWSLLRRDMDPAGAASDDGPRRSSSTDSSVTPGAQDAPPDDLTPDSAPLVFEDLLLPLDVVDSRWHGAKLVEDGAHGNAASFDGGTAHIDIGPCPAASTRPFTLRASIRTRESGFCTILIARDGEAVGPALNLGRIPGHVSFEAWSWRTVRLTSRYRVDDGAWHQIEVTYDPVTQGAILSVDSVRQDAAVLGAGDARTASLRLGDNIGAVYPYRGNLDEVAILRHTAHPEAFGAGAPTGR